MDPMRRRCFLRALGAGALASASLSSRLAASPSIHAGGAPASEVVRVAVIGVNGRGKSLAGGFAATKGCRVAAVCDVDASTLAPAVAEVERAGGERPSTVTDWRRLLDDSSIDALVIATPDHWHAPMTVAACIAGKDVYVEKPVSHNVVEGRAMVRAARRHGRVVQVGTQRRSQPMMREACELVRSGKLGKVAMARTWMTSTRPNIGRKPDTAVPEGVDWDLWRGPAPMRPFNQNRFHYHWRWFWDTGTGEIGNNGVHLLDVARWGLGVDRPVRVSSAGGQLVHLDDRETPDTHLVSFEFDSGTVLTWEHRIWSKRGVGDWTWGIEFYGEHGTVRLRDQEWSVVASDGFDATHQGASGWRQHLEEFLGCVRTRERPSADIEVGHLSTTLCHLGNIAHRTRSTLEWDGEREAVIGNEAASRLLTREYREGFALPAV